VIIVFGFLLVLVAVQLLGGDLRRALEVPLRAQWLVVLALVVQIAITTWAADSVHGTVGDVLHLATYALAAAFFVANRRVRGLWLVAVGGALNLVAIAANGGVMPASRWAVETAGLPIRPDEFANSQALAHPRLLPLGDVFAVPAGWPFANVFSVGDVVLLIGAFFVLYIACGCRRRRIDPTGAWARR
jgi:hypothetical protein